VPRTAAATTALIQIAARTGQAPGTRITSTAMAKAKQKAPPTPKHWEVYHLARAGKRLGTVEAADAEEALQKAVEEFKQTSLAPLR